MLAGILASPRRRALVLGALAAVVALVIGYLGGLIVPRLSTPDDNSPEAGFARDMSVHHAQAVEMAMIVWQRSGNLEVRWGDHLEQVVRLEPRDLVYVPPRETHVLENLSDTQAAEYVVARDAPQEDSVEVPWAQVQTDAP